MAIQFNFRVGKLGHIYIMAGHTATAMAFAQTVQEDLAFKSLPTYLLAKHLALQLKLLGLIPAEDVHLPFKPSHVVQVGFSEEAFSKLFGTMSVESIAAFDMPASPEQRL
mgnify:CR=1 FL=1